MDKASFAHGGIVEKTSAGQAGLYSVCSDLQWVCLDFFHAASSGLQ